MVPHGKLRRTISRVVTFWHNAFALARPVCEEGVQRDRHTGCNGRYPTLTVVFQPFPLSLSCLVTVDVAIHSSGPPPLDDLCFSRFSSSAVFLAVCPWNRIQCFYAIDRSIDRYLNLCRVVRGLWLIPSGYSRGNRRLRLRLLFLQLQIDWI